MAAIEILENVSQDDICRLDAQAQNAIDDVISACLVGRIEIARLDTGLEWSHDDSRRIGTKMQRLAIQECGLGQVCLD